MDNNIHSSKITTTPFKDSLIMYTRRLGIVLSNISMVCTFLSFAALLSVILFAMIMIVSLFVNILGIAVCAIFTVGLIFLAFPFSEFWFVDNILNILPPESFDTLFNLTPYFAGIGLGCALISLILMLVNRRSIPVVRVVISAFTVIVPIVLFVAFIIVLSTKGAG